MAMSLKEKILSLDRKYNQGRFFLIKNGMLGSDLAKITAMNKNPLFIGGCGRSGTTLLLSLISVHPDIYAIPHETRAVSSGGYNPEKEVSENKELYIDVIYKHLIESEKSISTFDRWCEKTPMNIHFVEGIFEYFGSDARFINVIRDGRDVVTSRHPSDPSSYYVTPYRWVRDVKAGCEVEAHPRVLTIYYEDLVGRHISTMQKVFTFLEMSFPESMYDYPKSSQFSQSDAWFGKVRPVSDASCGRWKQSEHEERVEEFMSTPGAEDLLSHYDYL